LRIAGGLAHVIPYWQHLYIYLEVFPKAVATEDPANRGHFEVDGLGRCTPGEPGLLILCNVRRGDFVYQVVSHNRPKVAEVCCLNGHTSRRKCNSLDGKPIFTGFLKRGGQGKSRDLVPGFLDMTPTLFLCLPGYSSARASARFVNNPSAEERTDSEGSCPERSASSSQP